MAEAREYGDGDSMLYLRDDLQRWHGGWWRNSSDSDSSDEDFVPEEVTVAGVGGGGRDSGGVGGGGGGSSNNNKGSSSVTKRTTRRSSGADELTNLHTVTYEPMWKRTGLARVQHEDEGRQFQKGQRRTKRMWEEAEVKALRAAVEVHSVGNWAGKMHARMHAHVHPCRATDGLTTTLPLPASPSAVAAADSDA